jgi:hypothetical protein
MTAASQKDLPGHKSPHIGVDQLAGLRLGRCQLPTISQLSQTGRTTPDQGGLSRHLVDPDQWLRILAHWLDAWH